MPREGPTTHPEALFWSAGPEPDSREPGMTIASETKKQIIAQNRRHDTDSGSPEVQIAVLTAEIE